jgi:nucleoside-diphosphate-sugar epimerase
MRFLITGGDGNVGPAIVERVRQMGDVVIFDRGIGDDHECETISGDVREFSVVDEACVDVDIVLHAAAITDLSQAEESPEQCFDVNVSGTYNVCKAANRHDVQKLVFFSSREVYGRGNSVTENAPLDPVNVYGRSKAAAEGIVRQIGPSHLVLRTTNLFGTGSDVVSAFVEDVVHGREIQQYGNPTLDLLSLPDFLDIVEELLRTDTTGTYNVGSGQTFTLDRIVEILATETEQELTRTESELPAYYTETFSADVSALLETIGTTIPDQRDRVIELLDRRRGEHQS